MMEWNGVDAMEWRGCYMVDGHIDHHMDIFFGMGAVAMAMAI